MFPGLQATVNRVSANVRQQMVERTRRMEEAREDSLRQLQRDRVTDASILADDRVEDKRMIRAMQQMAQENEMQESLLRVCEQIHNVFFSVIC